MAGKTGKLTSVDDVRRVETTVRDLTAKGDKTPGKTRKILTKNAIDRNAVMAEVERQRPGFVSKPRPSK